MCKYTINKPCNSHRARDKHIIWAVYFTHRCLDSVHKCHVIQGRFQSLSIYSSLAKRPWLRARVACMVSYTCAHSIQRYILSRAPMFLGRSMATAGATCTVMHGRSLCHRLVGCGYGTDLEAKLEAVRTGGVGQVDGADRHHEIHLQQAGEGGREGEREGGRGGREGGHHHTSIISSSPSHIHHDSSLPPSPPPPHLSNCSRIFDTLT